MAKVGGLGFGHRQGSQCAWKQQRDHTPQLHFSFAHPGRETFKKTYEHCKRSMVVHSSPCHLGLAQVSPWIFLLQMPISVIRLRLKRKHICQAVTMLEQIMHKSWCARRGPLPLAKIRDKAWSKHRDAKKNKRETE